MIKLQGVKEATAKELCHGNMWSVLPRSEYFTDLKSSKTGFVQHIDAAVLGRVCVDLGAGRSSGNDQINLSVGLEVLKTLNEAISETEAWIRVYHKGKTLDKQLKNCLEAALVIGSCPGEETSKIVKQL
jgi:thymidine phosphorylase